MLLVARRVGEALRIGSDIEVKVVASSRSRVLLAVSAPRELDIRRIYGKSDNKSTSPPQGEAPQEPAADAPQADQGNEDNPTSSKRYAGE